MRLKNLEQGERDEEVVRRKIEQRHKCIRLGRFTVLGFIFVMQLVYFSFMAKSYLEGHYAFEYNLEVALYAVSSTFLLMFILMLVTNLTLLRQVNRLEKVFG